MSNDLASLIQKLYLDYIRSCDDRIVKRKEAWDAIREAVLSALASGEVDLDQDKAAHDAFLLVDADLTTYADEMIQVEIEDGQSPLLPMDLDALVKLGDGDRILYGDIGMVEYQRWDDLKYKNLQDAQASYDRFRRAHDPLRAGLMAGLTIRQIAAGAS